MAETGPDKDALASLVADPAIHAAIQAVYDQGFEAGRLHGLEEGRRLGFADGLETVRKAVGTIAATPYPPQPHPGWTLNTPIEDLNLSVRAYNCLKRWSVHTIGDLVRWRETDLLDIRNFGQRSIAEVEQALAKAGFALRDDSLPRDPELPE